MTTYSDFITRKAAKYLRDTAGLNVKAESLHPRLYDFQRLIVERALSWGRAALFEDCGLGKTIQELEWSRHIHEHTGKPVLIFAPLAVGNQMVREGECLGLNVKIARRQSDVQGISVTNYEMMGHFDPTTLGGVVLDESGILKGEFGKTRIALTEFVSHIPYRIAATATPAPNDLPELLNHAEYLGVMSRKEALALFFTQDGNSTQNWRLKKHAVADFWEWVGTWAMVARTPDDIGCPMDGYDLPELKQFVHTVDYESTNSNGKLFSSGVGLAEMRQTRRDSLHERVQKCADLVNRDSRESWVVWCELNDESHQITKKIPDAVEIKGSDSMVSKIAALEAFSTGMARVIVTKPSIAGHGLNWQHCARMVFVGSSYSYEQQYQAIRRCWRYGQEREVEVHHIGTEEDIHVMEVVQGKHVQHESLYDNIPWQVNDASFAKVREYESGMAEGDGWKLYLGDSVETIDAVESESVGLSVFSPPFPGMYVYTDSPHDMGNVSSIGEMVDQFGYLMGPDKLMRILMPGRSVFIHITQGIAQLGRDSYVGLKDFRGDIIRMMDGHGWHYYGEVTIDKNPQVKAVRTMDGGLQFKSLRADSSRMHCAMSDMLLQFRKPGENPNPIKAGGEQYGNTSGWVTNEDWILWARPVWYADDYKPLGSENVPGISETNVLNVAEARTMTDERHLCPLQLDVIERCVKVWSAPGETVYSPFAGVGSEGVVALREGRRFVGGELKRSYWEKAKLNLTEAGSQKRLM